MNLWLLRHGEAEQRVSTDEARQLTAHGQHEVLLTALKLNDKPIDLILHSPYVRAVQTAELVIKTIGYTSKVQQIAWITPDDDSHKAVKELDKLTGKNILIVSHQPFLGILAALLTDGSQQFPLSLRTAELLALQGEEIGLGTMQLSN